MLRNKLFKKDYNFELKNDTIPLKWIDHYTYQDSYLQNNTFQFLNIKHLFNNEIDWNLNEYGKLWTYNLNYFDFLLQDGITKDQGMILIGDFISNKGRLKDGIEPYPISLRGINWIKFLSIHKVENKSIDSFLYNDYKRLTDNLEYHILGNHLLENGFSLLFAAYYFDDDEYYNIARNIIEEELIEQVLDDGAHFELSSMYHKILLTKLLDCYQLVCTNDNFKDNALKELLKQKAELMLGFLDEISFNNGAIPLLNDSSDNIALESSVISKYAYRLDLKPNSKSLNESGYRKYFNTNYEVLADIGPIGPDYQPGHAHADTFNIILNVKNNPVLVDPGVTTYEINNIRESERSTEMHNTVTINNKNSSQIWNGFRVGNRANVKILKDKKQEIIAEHDGYKKYEIVHKRSLIYKNDRLIIKDSLSKFTEGRAFFHLHPGCLIKRNKNIVTVDNLVSFVFEGQSNITIKEYNYSQGFNKSIRSDKIIVQFKKELKTSLLIR